MEAAASELAGLAAAAETFCQRPDQASHQTAKDAWTRADNAWELSELNVLIGPADMLRTLSKVDYAPASESGIDEMLASEATIDFDYVDNRAASTDRGLGAVEYTLFRDTAAAGDPRVCELTIAASAVAAEAARELTEAWTVSFDGGEPWESTFTVRIPSNQALGDLVAAMVETTKRQSLFEIGQALGISAPQPELDAIPEGAAGAGSQMYLSQLEGIRQLLAAGEDDSLGALIRARSSEVADRIDIVLGEAMDGLAVLDGPMRQIADERPEELEPIYDDVAELRTLFESDVVSLLDITLGFSDTDGDSG
jgi:predicted lipoprotein